MDAHRRHVWTVLVVAIALSVAGNVAGAKPSAGGRIVAALPPVALILTLHTFARIPVTSRAWFLSTLRVGGVAIVASIAAWASYWHMSHAFAHFGENPWSAHLLPLLPDGMIGVATVALLELRRGAGLEPVAMDPPAAAASPDPRPAVEPDPADPTADPDPGPPAEPIPFPKRPQVVPDLPPAADGTRSDQARALKAAEPHLTNAEIAARVGLSPSAVSRALARVTETDQPDTVKAY